MKSIRYFLLVCVAFVSLRGAAMDALPVCDTLLLKDGTRLVVQVTAQNTRYLSFRPCDQSQASSRRIHKEYIKEIRKTRLSQQEKKYLRKKSPKANSVAFHWGIITFSLFLILILIPFTGGLTYYGWLVINVMAGFSFLTTLVASIIGWKRPLKGRSRLGLTLAVLALVAYLITISLFLL